MSRKAAKRDTQSKTQVGREAPALSAPGGLRESGVRLGGVALRSLTYQELSLEGAPPNAGAPRMGLNLELGGDVSVRIQEDGTQGIELTLAVLVRPDPTVKPIELRATMSAVFYGDQPLELIARFVNTTGSRLLFPYIRELVSAATARGIYGPVFIDPILIGPLATDDQVTEMLVAFAAEHPEISVYGR